MTILKFPAAPMPALASLKENLDAELTQKLKALPNPGAKARKAASSATEILREPHAAYWMDGRPQASVSASMMAFAAALPFLSDDRIDHWMALVRHAVAVEMKHWKDSEYALHPDYDDEVLVDLADYLDDDEERAEASRDNRELWAELAETATCFAVAENALSHSQAA